MLKKLFQLLLYFVVFQTVSEAHNLEYVNSFRGDEISVNRRLWIEDDWYMDMQYGGSYEQLSSTASVSQSFDRTKRYTNVSTVGHVGFRWDGSAHEVFSGDWSYEVDLEVYAWNAQGQSLGVQFKTLRVDYEHGHLKNYKDWDELRIPHASKLYAEIKGVRITGIASQTVLSDLILETSIEVERYFHLDLSAQPNLYTANIVQQTGIEDQQVELSWSYLEGAEYYDVEWVYVSSELDGYQPIDLLDWTKASRVSLSAQDYRLELPYENGVLYYRVRAVGYGNKAHQALYGSWSVVDQIDITGNSIIGNSTAAYFDEGRNWTYSAAYAEEGKRSEQLAYVDGLGRGRQMVTKDNETGNSIVGESVYDHEGRAALQMSPSVSTTYGLGFHEAYNLNNQLDVFAASDFDEASHYTDPTTVSPLSTTTGAAKYYSNANSSSNKASSAYIAGTSIPYTRTVFDAWGRVHLQSGAGEAHGWGSERESVTYYGTVEQELLDELLGSAAGYADYYRMTISRDANNQKSMTIENQAGQPVATALIGSAAAETELSDLATDKYRYSTTQSRVASLGQFNRYGDEDGPVWRISRDLAMVEATTHDFNYTFDPPSDYAACSGSLSADYVLEIALYDWQGERVVLDGRAILQTGSNYISQASELDGPISIPNNSGSVTISFSIPVTDNGGSSSIAVGSYRLVKELRLANLTEIASQLSTAIEGLDPLNNSCYAYTDENWYVNSCEETETVNASTTEEILSGQSYGSDFNSLSCEDMEAILIADMSPGGQYFDNSPSATSPNNDWLSNNLAAVNSYNFTYTDLGGQQQMATDWDAVRTYWNPSWGAALLEEHPEYCFYEHYCLASEPNNLISSRGYDQDLLDEPDPTPIIYNAAACSPQSTHSIVSADPVYTNNLVPNYETDMMNLICNYRAGYNMFEVAIEMVLPNNTTPYNNLPAADKIKISNYFEQLYLGEKRKLVDAWLDTQCSRLTDTDADPTVSTNNGFEIRYPLYEGIIDEVETLSTQTGSWEAADEYINSLADDYALCGHQRSVIDLPCFNETNPSLLDKELYLVLTYTTTQNPFGAIGSHPISLNLASCWSNGFNNAAVPNPLGPGIESCYVEVSCIESAVEQALFNALGASWTSHFRISVETYGIGADASVRIILDALDLDYTGTGGTTVVSDYTNAVFGLYYKNTFGGATYIPVNASGFEEVSCEGAYQLCLCEEIDYYLTEEGLSVSDLAALYVAQYPTIAWQNLNGSFASAQAGAENFVTTINTNCNTAYSTGSSTDGLESQDELVALIDILSPLVPTDLSCWIPNVPTCVDELIELENFYEALEIEDLQQAAVASELSAYIAHFMPDLSAVADGPDALDHAYTTNRYHYTLYYYDVAGNLVQTVPPAGVTTLDLATQGAAIGSSRDNKTTVVEPMHVQQTTYAHTTLGGIYESSSPDAGLAKMYYDELGRVVLTQTSRQAAANAEEIAYIIYDELNRAEESGVLYDKTAGSNYVQTNLATNTVFSSYSTYLGYMDGTDANLEKKEVNWADYNESGLTTGYLFVQGQQQLRNRVASQRYSTTGEANNLDHGVAYSYDVHGNAAEIVQTYRAHAGQVVHKSLEYDYDLVSGVVHAVYYQRGKKDQLTHRYGYDANNRLVAVESSLNGYIWDRDAAYEYYDHGPLRRIEIGEDKVQAMDYVYTMHGWIKSVNSGHLNEAYDPGRDGFANSTIHTAADLHQWVAKDVYGYNVHYYDGDYSPIANLGTNSPIVNVGTYSNGLYNGNIRSVLHGQTHPEDIGQSQGQQMMDIAWKRYSYDQLNRITGSVVDETAGSNLSLSGGEANWGVVDHGNHYGTGHTYDANGNILSLTRSYQGVMIDDLNYYYANQAAVAQTGSMSWGLNSYFTNNQLLYVEDNATGSGTKGDLLTQAVGNYEYEEDGALLKDASEEIDEIIWTASGKLKEVKRIASSSKPDLEYRYDAWDNRMLKIVKPATGTNHHYTQYVRDMNGNVMAVYEYTVNSSLTPPYTLGGMPAVYLKEQMLYGAQRLGVIKRDLMVSGPIQIVNDGVTALGVGDPLTTDYMIRAYWQHLESENDGAYKEFGSSAPEIIDHVVLSNQLQTLAKEANRSGLYITSVASVQLIPMMQRYERIRGRRHYELSNFRGDVRQVVTDIRIAVDETGDTKAEYYEADVIQVEDAYPFGWSIEDRSFAHNEAYRFGFNGTEVSDEIGAGHNTTFFREMDTRIARWWSADPVIQSWQSPYNSMDGNPILYNDPLGNHVDGDYYHYKTGKYLGSDGKDDKKVYAAKGKDATKKGKEQFLGAQDLGINRETFRTFVRAVHKESGHITREETYAIANAVVNHSKRFEKPISSLVKNVKFMHGAKNDITFKNDKLLDAQFAVINALGKSASPEDYSNGSDHWDGADLAAAGLSHYRYSGISETNKKGIMAFGKENAKENISKYLKNSIVFYNKMIGSAKTEKVKNTRKTQLSNVKKNMKNEFLLKNIKYHNPKTSDWQKTRFQIRKVEGASIFYRERK